jgi:hypothetical protein
VARPRQKLKKQCFVLEVNGRPVLGFLASDLNQARDLCSKDWFITELASYHSGGIPVFSGMAKLGIRVASALETAEVQMALVGELTRGEYNGHIFAFLLPVDAPRL